ncbi:MAG: META domain-containing protein [Anaerolineales bacterium]|nr:META domain-containing protein [Anaerolineales bacterium]
MNIRQIKKYIVVVGSLALVSIFLAACAPITPVAAPPAADAASTPAPAGESAAPTLEGVVWELVSYRDDSGAQVEATAPASIALEAGSISGSAGCNRLFASYVVDGSQLTIEPGGSSMMMCDEAVMAQEAAVLANLGKVTSYAIDEAGQLDLLDADGNVVLSFTEQVAPSLTGVVWEATNYNNGREAVVGVLEGTKITALFGEDGMLSGSAGCNNYVTGYTVDGNSLTIEPAASTMMMCPEPEGVMEQEAAYLAALAIAATYSIRDGVLEMRTADDAMVARYVVSTDEEPANPDEGNQRRPGSSGRHG